MSKFVGDGSGWDFGNKNDKKTLVELAAEAKKKRFADTLEGKAMRLSILSRKAEIKAGFNPDQTRGKGGKWSKTHWHNVDLDTQAATHNKTSGSTYMQDGQNMAGAKGMGSVSIYPEKSLLLEGQMTRELLNDYYETNKDFLLLHPDHAVGTWYSSAQKKTYYDIIVVRPLKEAITLGIDNNQEAIFNLETMQEISTGGTGEAKSENPNDKDTKENWANYGAYIEKLRSKD